MIESEGHVQPNLLVMDSAEVKHSERQDGDGFLTTEGDGFQTGDGFRPGGDEFRPHGDGFLKDEEFQKTCAGPGGDGFQPGGDQFRVGGDGFRVGGNGFRIDGDGFQKKEDDD